MFVLDHFLTKVELLLASQVLLDWHFLGFVGPHSFLDAQTDFFLLYLFGFGEFLQLFFVLLRDVFSRNDCGFFANLKGNEAGVLFEEGRVEEEGFGTEDESDLSFFWGFEDRVGDNDVVPIFELFAEFGVETVDSASAGGEGACAFRGFMGYELILFDDVLELLGFVILVLAVFGGKRVQGFGDGLFEFEFAYSLRVVHVLY